MSSDIGFVFRVLSFIFKFTKRITLIASSISSLLRGSKAGIGSKSHCVPGIPESQSKYSDSRESISTSS